MMKMMNLCGAALCVLAVAACADRMNQTSNTAGSDSGYSSTPLPDRLRHGRATPATSYGVVQAIDQMQRQDVGVGVMGAAAAGSMPTDKVYRVTVGWTTAARKWWCWNPRPATGSATASATATAACSATSTAARPGSRAA
jgi:hypothetical protein